MNEDLSPYFTTEEAMFRARNYGYRYLTIALTIGMVIMLFKVTDFIIFDPQVTEIFIGFIALIGVVMLVGSMHEMFIVPWRPYKIFIQLCQTEGLLAQGDELALTHDRIGVLRDTGVELPSRAATSTIDELDSRYRLMADQLNRRQRPLLKEAFRRYGKPCPWQLPKPQARDDTRDRLIRERLS